MSKKSFKRLQNRLYREIKHRMELERSQVIMQMEIAKIDVKKIKAGYKIPNCYDALEQAETENYARRYLTQEIAEGLNKQGYIRYYTDEDEFGPYKTLYAEMCVVHPDAHKYARD